MSKKIIVEKFVSDSEVSSDKIQSIVLQKMLWEQLEECRVYITGGEMYSAIIDSDQFITEFVLVPNKGEVK